jgi:5'-nucleotidase
MNRRHFIQKSAAGSTALGLGLSGCYSNSDKHITILHTNDVHSHVDPFPSDHGAFPNLGGIARRAAQIERILTENPNTLILDAGDIFQGTPYFNFYGGELEFKLMSKLGYHAATLGNHDFDNGLNGLLAQLPHATFDFVSSNYDFSNTILDGYIKRFSVFERAGIRIGVFGLGIDLNGLVLPELYGETIYLDPYEIGQDMARYLRKTENCQLVICLSHLGYSYKEHNRASDIGLAGATSGIDLIIGGHTHTFLEKADIRINSEGKEVVINQVGCFGVNLGRVDFVLGPTAEKKFEGVSITV